MVPWPRTVLVFRSMKVTTPLGVTCALVGVAVNVSGVPGASGLAGGKVRLAAVGATGAKATPRRAWAAKMLLPIVTEPSANVTRVFGETAPPAAPWLGMVARPGRWGVGWGLGWSPMMPSPSRTAVLQWFPA